MGVEFHRKTPKWVDWSMFLLPWDRYVGGLPILINTHMIRMLYCSFETIS